MYLAGTTPAPVTVTSPSGISPLAVSVTAPKKGKDFTTRKKKVTLRGAMSPETTVLSVKGQDATTTPGSTTWSASVTLQDGDNSVDIVAKDVTGTRSATASVTITLDTDAPGSVRELRAVPGAAGTTLTWKSPKDKDVAGYHIYRIVNKAAEEIDATRSREITVDGGGTFAVTAEDTAGNESDVDAAPRVQGSADSGFSDVPLSHFAATAVGTLRQRGIVQGRDGFFSPDALVTRGEFAKMLAGVRGAGAAAPSGFRDVSARDPLAGAIGAIVSRGWASGQGDHFYPSRPVSRIEAARMIVRAAGLPAGGRANKFRDIANGDEQTLAAALVQAGVARGDGGKFFPYRQLTRAEAAKMLAAVLSTK